MSDLRAGFGLYFLSFALLIAAGALVAGAAITFLSSLTPLYVSIGLSVAAVVCAMAGLARHVRISER